MIISENFANFLKHSSLAEVRKLEDKHYMSPESFEQFEYGPKVLSMLKLLLQDRSEIFQSVDSLQNVKSQSAKLYNWKLILSVLKSSGFEIDQETKAHVLSGDKDFLTDMLERVHKFFSQSHTPSKARIKKPKLAPDGALYIESIDSRRNLLDTDSCLEFLLISFCQNFSLFPKQAAGLLTQGNKFLAHIIVKGLKGDHLPVQTWFTALEKNCEKMCALIKNEASKGAINLILSALRPGLLSKNAETAKKCSEVILRITEKLENEIQLVWEWFDKEGVEACILALQRVGEICAANIAKIWIKFTQEKLIRVVGDQLKTSVSEPYQYLKILQLLFQGFRTDPTTFRSNGLDFYLNFCLRNAEAKKIADPKTRDSYLIGKMNLLCDLWTQFVEVLSENSSEIISEIKLSVKDKSLGKKIIVVGRLFGVFEEFYQQTREVAVVILKTLIFMLIENFDKEALREYFLNCFAQVIEQNSKLPVFIILEPLLKYIQFTKNIRFNVFDYDFFLSVSRHPRLKIENAILLVDILSKVYIEDLLFSKAAVIPLMYLVSTYFERSLMQEYMFKFIVLSVSMVASGELASKATRATKKENGFAQIPFSKTKSENPDLEASADVLQRKHLVLDFVFKVIQLDNDQFNDSVASIILENNAKIKDATGSNYRGFETLLNLVGDASEMMKGYERKKIVIYKAEPQNIANKPLVIPGRVVEDIERAKQTWQMALKKKMRDEELVKKKEIKIHENALKDLEVLKQKSEKIGILENSEEAPKNENNLEYFDVALESRSEVEQIEKLFRRYYLPIITLFNKYSKSKFFKLEKSQPESKYLNETQIFEFLKAQEIVPTLLKRNDAYWIAKETCKKEGFSYSDPIMFSKKLFQKFLLQLSANIFRENDLTAISPLATSLYYLVMHFRSKEKFTKMYDDPDPGSADRETVAYLNLMLLKNPDYPLPPNIQKSVDYEAKIEYFVPKTVKLPKNYKLCAEILDWLLFSSLQVHLLSPQLIIEARPVAKGVFKPGNQKIPVLPLYLTVSPQIKCSILKLSAQYPLEHIVEAAKVLEEVLFSVSAGKNSLQHKMPMSTKDIKNDFKKKKEMLEQENLNSWEQSEQTRKKRRKELEMVLNLKKIELANKENQEKRAQEEAKQLENKKMMEAEERKKKEKVEKKKKVEEWKSIKEMQEKEKLMEKIKKQKLKVSASASLLPSLSKSNPNLLNLRSKPNNTKKLNLTSKPS